MRTLLCALLGASLWFSTMASAREVHHRHSARPSHQHSIQQGYALASWYGVHEQGHRMADGQRFDRRKFTVANRTLPFGSRVIITNPRTGRQVVVTVTDRGPQIRSRLFDLAEAPAKTIGCSGVCRVHYVVLTSKPSL